MSLTYPGSCHNHTEYSNECLRDSINRIGELMDYAIKLGHEVIAFTEHETISNAIKIEEYYNKIKKDHPDFKVILGNEIYLCRDGLDKDNYIKGEDKYYHFVLLAKDAEGHKQIRQLSSRAWKRSWMQGKMRRRPTYYQDLIDIVGANPGHVIGSTACFLPGQKVRTLNGDKNIEDITENDYILNSEGKWEKINFPTSREYSGLGSILEISKEPEPIKCTADHKFLTYDYKTEQVNWVEAKNLKKQDWLLEPIVPIQYTNSIIINYSDLPSIVEYREKPINTPNYRSDIYRIQNKIILTNEIMRLFGLWLADGHISKKEKYYKNNIGFTFSITEFDIFYNSFVKKALEDLGLNEDDYSIIKRPENNRVDLSINKVEICLMFYDLFGNSHADTKFIPNRLKHISKDFDMELFFGYMLGDGYFRYRKSSGGEAVAASISYQLIKDFEQLSNSFNLSGSITITPAHIGKDGTNHQESYYLTYSNATLGKELTKERHISHEELINILVNASNKKKGFAEFVEINNIKYRIKKVKTNTNININEKVYCLNTDSHNFVLNNVVVHNCLGGFLDTKLLQCAKTADEELYKKIKAWCQQIENIFGKGNFYLEMQPSANEEQFIANKGIYKLSKELDIPFIITCDSHYCKKEDAFIHKAFLNSQDGDREVDAFYATTYLMGTEELEGYMSNFSVEVFQEAYQNILDIKNKCEDYSLKKELKIPSLKWRQPKTTIIDDVWYERIPYLKTFYNSDFNGDRVLAQLLVDKFNSDSRLCNQEHYDEVNDNLKITWISSEVNKAHWSAYFLNLQQIIDVCWQSGTLVGPGRGSGVGFLLLYMLDIIQINPLWETTKTFSWRFLNPSRVSVLDIDTDVEGGRRAQVLQALRDYYGENRVANVVTFGTEQSKSAIQTAARGLGLEAEDALYYSSLIPADRGKTRTLSQCYYGDKDNDFKPIPTFVRAMNDNPELWRVAQKIEGLVCRVGEHAGGVIFVDEDFEESTALMRVPNGDLVTQFDLHDSESASLIKIDLLSVECLDKIHSCLDLLCEHRYVEREPTLKETYEKVIGIYNIERKDPKMWEMVWEHKIESLFQMEQQSGIQGIALIKPKSVDELAILNSVIRLMAPDKDSSTPLEMWAQYRRNITLWYDEMERAGLTTDEIEWLKNSSAVTEGICESQEGLMSLVQDPRLGGHDLNYADKCRKALAKKIGSLFDECERIFFETIDEQGLSKKLANYVWNTLLRVQRGYSFNRSHCLAYSLVALQEMNLAFKFPIIFWNTACLITDSGGTEDSGTDGKNNNYDKIAKAIGKMTLSGVTVNPPDINKSQYTFTPNVNENKIYYGLRGMLNIGEEIIQDIMINRPYTSPKDFYLRVKPKRQVMISLIKGGAFDEMIDRKICMGWYIWETCDKKKRLTLQNMPGLIKHNLLPEVTEEQVMARRIYEFNRYLKAVCKDTTIFYKLDERAINFLTEIEQDNLIVDGFKLDQKLWDKKVYQPWMDVFRNWIFENKDEILNNLNTQIFLADWNKYAKGNYSSWEMEVLCFYYHEHELQNVNNQKYGFSDFSKLPEIPVVERSFSAKDGKQINIFKLSQICGTCIAKNKAKGSVTLLTTSGIAEVKFRKEYFSIFDKQISGLDENGERHILEKSFFNRGSKILVQGFRSGNNFIPKKYAHSVNQHMLYKITNIFPDGTIELQHNRIKGDAIDSED